MREENALLKVKYLLQFRCIHNFKFSVRNPILLTSSVIIFRNDIFIMHGIICLSWGCCFDGDRGLRYEVNVPFQGKLASKSSLGIVRQLKASPAIIASSIISSPQQVCLSVLLRCIRIKLGRTSQERRTDYLHQRCKLRKDWSLKMLIFKILLYLLCLSCR